MPTYFLRNLSTTLGSVVLTATGCRVTLTASTLSMAATPRKDLARHRCHGPPPFAVIAEEEVQQR
ncbi:hypothetical protein E2562_015322 [Oryza meyeriana var. granulata]|uniref:Uncharacterized protein n=1 Tax=Oryza meyeriana var. granulata TaxID=110450 RepID=A0A6G1DJL2_9ORYZ|nr:hypothetical protein E2562_015322 [Oryza meyeriana var. granulata]